MTELTAEKIQDMFKEALGPAMAELREEHQARGKELDEKFEQLKAKEEELDRRLEEDAAKHVTDRKYTYAAPFMDGGPAENAKQHKGVAAARFLRLLAAGGGNPMIAAGIAAKWGDKFMEKALNESVFEAGGALVPEQFMTEVIDLLRARTVVRAMGAPSIPMPGGTLTMSYQRGPATAGYIGELETIAPSQQDFGQMTLAAKKLAALVPISNDLLRDASPNVDQIVRNDLVRVMALREDIAFIRDDGSNNTPKGLRFQAPASHVNAISGTALADITNDLHDDMLALENADIPMLNTGWILSPRTASGIMRLRDTNGQFVFRDEMLSGNLMGHPFMKTTQIPTNLGGGSNESEWYFADFSSLVIGETLGLTISAFDGGAYSQGGQVRAGVSTDETILRAIARHDFGARQRGYEVVVRTGITY